jgi:hypothetical protein
MKLLKRILTNEQYEEYIKTGAYRHFGKRYDYLTRKGDTIEVIDKDSLSPIGTLCVVPDFPGPGELPPTDVAIHQIVWLRRDENVVWDKGNFMPYS